ncbi:hypothetical protein PALB_35400 [Pseudoalteromonas luteoviolacea B = ATCC 29581]|nr:hypothetical protein PALB_35400 [Pseudoalteromonas luteoviolacea B = ATCC 29581]
MRLRHFILNSLVAFALSWSSLAFANEKTYLIYHDADYSTNSSSALAIKMGLDVALKEHAALLNGVRLQIVEKDHRGNARRSLQNMKNFINDDQALFVFGGMHSPPYLENLAFINENRIPLLVPWAAAGPITRYNKSENWVYRLSIDDTVAGIKISQFALEKQQCKKPHLLLESTGWGKSNHRTMGKYLENKVRFNVSWFAWGTKYNAAKIILRDIISSGSDCVLFVGNAPEAEVFFGAASELAEKNTLKIISHWGFTGGDINRIIPKHVKEQLPIYFIQSCYSFSSPIDDVSKRAITKAKKLYPVEFAEPKTVKSQAGFIHAYDFGTLIAHALSSVTLSGNVTEDRTQFKKALETLDKPIKGLVKTYHQPFQSWHSDNEAAHEALTLSDFCMAHYDDKNAVIIDYD